MLTRTFISFDYTVDIKSLPGFVKGGRDKIPKEFSEYQNKLVAGWAEQTIKDHIENVATSAKISLGISAREFQTPYYESGSGSFECNFFNYNFSVSQSEEDSSECVFTGLLEVQNLDSFDETKNTIDDCFEHEFEKATSSLPKEERDIRELIYSIDDNRKVMGETFDFTYENDFSAFQLVHKENGAVITANDQGLEINFQKSESIHTMLSVLKKVNDNIFTTNNEKPALLNM